MAGIGNDQGDRTRQQPGSRFGNPLSEVADQLKLALRAFNGECDAAIAKVAWNNATRMEERIRRSFDAINQLGEVMQVSLAARYRELRLSELRLEHEQAETKREIVEEQRRIREQMKDEERAHAEAERAVAEAQAEETRFQKALDKARLQLQKSRGEEHTRLTARIAALEGELASATAKATRAKSLAEMTKAGYVYVISNIGSFGENVFKIGMTRRLDPMDRVRELGAASVPFPFDVHAMVYSEDAPALESAFHQRFRDRSLNLVNLRKEFFQVSLEELDAFAQQRGVTVALTRLAEAVAFRRLDQRLASALLVRDEPTLRRVLETMMHHIHVHNEAVAVQVDEQRGLVVVRTELSNDGSSSLRQATELVVGVSCRLLQVLMGASWQPRLVCFTHPAPRSLSVHHRVLGPAVEFGHEFNGIVCNAADLDAPNPGADPVMARYSQKLLAPALTHSARFTDRVRQLVVLLLPRGLCRVEVVAQHLGVDRRTVHRKLQAEDTSFSALLEGERRALASRYVDSTDRPLTEVAALLGFTAPSAFSRWYRSSFGGSATRQRALSR